MSPLGVPARQSANPPVKLILIFNSVTRGSSRRLGLVPVARERDHRRSSRRLGLVPVARERDPEDTAFLAARMTLRSWPSDNGAIFM